MRSSVQGRGLISRISQRVAKATLASAIVVVSVIVVAQSVWAQPNNPENTPANMQSIKHVIIIFQENRSTDNMFHDPKLIANGADIASYGMNSKGKRIKLGPVALTAGYDPDHGHHAFELMYDGGKMDGADRISVLCGKGCPPNPQFKYIRASDVAPDFQIAEQYTFADRMFQTHQGTSFPGHQFIFAGTSAPTATSDLFAAEDIVGAPHVNWDMGCEGNPKATVMLIDTAGHENQRVFPCFDHPTLSDLLDNAGLTWRFYAISSKSLWTAPDAIKHIREGADWANVIIPQTQILTDIANGQLASVSWVTPSGQASDHPQFNTGLGPSWVAAVVNAVGTSQYWNSTAIFISWDDWGGWYDHVPPPQVLVDCQAWGCGYVYGFRVPLIVVSPYAKQSYISKADHDYGSILKFIEEVFTLPSLGYADAYADDLSDCFNFSQGPRGFRTIAAPRNADFFLHDRTPPADLDTD
jgi:phospholipase C